MDSHITGKSRDKKCGRTPVKKARIVHVSAGAVELAGKCAGAVEFCAEEAGRADPA